MPLSAPDPGLLDRLRAIVGAGGWLPPEADSPYLVEPRGWLQGRAAIILQPDSTEQVARIVAECAAARVGVVPHGGGTGLVGGQLALQPPDPVVLGLRRMRRIRRVSTADDALVAEAGCTLHELRAAAERHGRRFPIRIASEGSCQIGGNLATNAGGMQVLRFGNARELCLGLEAVLADGRVWNGLRLLRKESRGYDLRHLLVGSEGTLGIITAAALRLVPGPAEVATALVAVPDIGAATELALALRLSLAEILSAVELMQRSGLQFVTASFPHLSLPMPAEHPWYVMVETEGGADSGAGDRLAAALAAAMERGQVTDAVLADSPAQQDGIRNLREAIPIANRKVRAIATHDISVPLERIPDFVEAFHRFCRSLDPELRSNVFGHLGDGNLHANLYPPPGRMAAEYRHLRSTIRQGVFAAVRALDGAVSAEHGVGRVLRDATIGHLPAVERDAMRAIKRALDPDGILNPGAVIDGDPGP